MCASSGTKFSLMKDEVSASAYDSASSRTQAPQAGAALKSISKGLFVAFAWASASSASLFHCSAIVPVLLNWKRDSCSEKAIRNSKSSDVSRNDDVICFDSKVEYHQRQLVDGSDPTYTHNGRPRTRKSHQRKLVDCSDPAYFTRSCRLDLKYPPTSVGGITLRS